MVCGAMTALVLALPVQAQGAVASKEANAASARSPQTVTSPKRASIAGRGGSAGRYGVSRARSADTSELADMLDMDLQNGDWPAVGDSVTTDDQGPYVGVHHGNHIYVRNDPKGVRLNGSIRKVLQFRTFDSDTGPTRNPRTQLDGPLMIKEGQEIWWGFAYLLPAGFPTKVERGRVQGNPFHTMGSIGSPNGGGSNRLGYGSYGGTWKFGVRYRNSGNWMWDMPREVNKWIDVVFRIKYERDDSGFVEVYKNDGSGWSIQKLDSYVGGGTRWTGQTTSGGFPKRPRIANYFLKDQYRHLGLDPVSIYFTEHKIATTFKRAKPHSYE